MASLQNRLSTYWVLFKLNVRDMRDAALKLTEHGFTVKGINALPDVEISANLRMKSDK